MILQACSDFMPKSDLADAQYACGNEMVAVFLSVIDTRRCL